MAAGWWYTKDWPSEDHRQASKYIQFLGLLQECCPSRMGISGYFRLGDDRGFTGL